MRGGIVCGEGGGGGTPGADFSAVYEDHSETGCATAAHAKNQGEKKNSSCSPEKGAELEQLLKDCKEWEGCWSKRQV